MKDLFITVMNDTMNEHFNVNKSMSERFNKLWGENFISFFWYLVDGFYVLNEFVISVS